MATYRTPDVYVEEISLFPPSVAEVETAIPAFIGYTERATKTVEDDLHMKPTRIKSMLEFEQYYGGGPTPEITNVFIDDSGSFKSADLVNQFFLYDSLRLFYDNGGGDCYIVSVGDYDDTPELGDDDEGMKGGLSALEKYDEPTIILFPDAVSMDGISTAEENVKDLYSLQQLAMAQCNKLKDRVAVFDLRRNDPNGKVFRDKVGINNLKYGMAYTPWLKVAMAKNVRYRDLRPAIKRYGSTSVAPLTSFTTSDNVKENIVNYDNFLDNLLNTTNGIQKGITTLLGDKSLRQVFSTKVDEYEKDRKVGTLKPVIELLYKLADSIDEWANNASNKKSGDPSEHKSALNDLIAQAREHYATLISYDLAAAADEEDGGVDGYTAVKTAYTEAQITNDNWKEEGGDNIFKNGTIEADAALLATLDAISTTDKDVQRMNIVLGKVREIFESINGDYMDVLEMLTSVESTHEMQLLEALPLYKNLVKGVNDFATVMPPSGAMAGVYAATDRDRGVWKAPANVSLNSVVGPDVVFAASELDALNIDVNAGKSINAIRAFAGKGTLVWGARTLAGNDNEWRYVPVRRFYNTVEESVKKSTYWAVFEPNTANTWLKVKGMIESYLTNKWKEGALAGAKPDEAFFVRVGLGQTMSADDILNGYMKVEIGMAVVRPAEFIVLKFSHKLQQS